MILNFADQGTEDIFHLKQSKAARKSLPIELHLIAKRKLNLIAVASQLVDLKVPPANRLERLKGRMTDFYSIRINDQWRICFEWRSNDAFNVEITDYH